MQYSINTLLINSLDYQEQDLSHMRSFRGSLEAVIEFKCQITGNTFRKLTITTYGKGYSDVEVLKNTVQAFLDGLVDTYLKYYDVPNQSIADMKNIHHLEVKLPEPFKSLFVNLFDLSKWSMPNEKLMGAVTTRTIYE